QEADGQIDRQPRQIKKSRRAGAGQESAHRIEVADRLRAFAFAADLERQPDDRVVNAHAHRFVETVPDAYEDTAADRVDEALRGVQPRGQDQERHERRYAAAW